MQEVNFVANSGTGCEGGTGTEAIPGAVSSARGPRSLLFCTFVPAGLKSYPVFFRENTAEFANIELGFHHVRGVVPSHVELWRGGRLQADVSLPHFPHVGRFWRFLLMPVIHLVHLFAVIRAGRAATRRGPADWYVGVNYFGALCGLALRRLGMVRRVIYRVLDFYPRRKHGIYHYLLPLYYRLDEFCLKNCDFVWFTTEGHVRGRKQEGYYSEELPHLFIPLGVDGARIAARPFTEVRPHSLVYVGVVNRDHGLGLMMSALPELHRVHPDVRLDVIGSGPDEKELRARVEADRFLSGIVHFHGYLSEDSMELREIVGRSSLGLALYLPDPEGFMQYTEPAKAKLYLSCGVPVLINRVPDLAGELGGAGAGIVVEYTPESVVKEVLQYWELSGNQLRAREAAVKYVRKFDTGCLLDRAIGQTLKHFEERDCR